MIAALACHQSAPESYSFMRGEKLNQSAIKPQRIRQVALTALLFALAMVLSLVESIVPIPAPLPGVRLGLSNIVVMFSLFFLRRRDALAIALLKSLFVLITRGVIAGILSFCGGLSSILVMVLLMHLFKTRISYLIVSIFGAVFHNIGQIAAASVILGTPLWFYLPLLLLSGVISGSATSVLLKVCTPAFQKLHLNRSN